MALTNQLVTKSELKALLGISDAVDDSRIDMACDSATQMVQAECDRTFFADTTASPRVFVMSTPWVCEVDDISTTTGLIVRTDDDDDGTFETTWTVTVDYQPEPVNGRLNGQPWPYTSIGAVGAREFPWDGRRPLVQVTARWGWPAIPAPVSQAAQIQAVSLFKSADAPLGIAGFGDIGVMRLRQAMHPVAAALLAPYRRDPVLVA